MIVVMARTQKAAVKASAGCFVKLNRISLEAGMMEAFSHWCQQV